jgi:hypothetical protein
MSCFIPLFFLVALALIGQMCSAREIMSLGGVIYLVETREVTCIEIGCCATKVKQVVGDQTFIMGNPYTLKIMQNGNEPRTSCPYTIVKSLWEGDLFQV